MQHSIIKGLHKSKEDSQNNEYTQVERLCNPQVNQRMVYLPINIINRNMSILHPKRNMSLIRTNQKRVKYVFSPYIWPSLKNSPYISINVFKIPTFYFRCRV